ncbi:CLUMA_CG008376, isoform A [Clunio marinus]|uniref:CLUMA_CG008376, isoform A n=1 Tax=Clunio marinus TaxID=568069 RepID=A0A1J1I5M5_9DIPT|nr:CLUMA_CG008376, isoform A [Clunio marinus]
MLMWCKQLAVPLTMMRNFHKTFTQGNEQSLVEVIKLRCVNAMTWWQSKYLQTFPPFDMNFKKK